VLEPELDSLPTSQICGSKGLVTTDHEPSTIAGIKILKKGGNAADAAVASAAALTVVDPYMAGLGGYGYLLFYSALEDRVFALDFVGEAPASASIDLFVKEKPWEDYKSTAEGPLSILVPGSVAGWTALLERFGSMKMREVLEPAIQLARGYRVSERVSTFYESIKPTAGRFPSTAKIFYKNGFFPKKGQRFVQKDLARTLSTLARNGGEDYYKGEVAKSIAKRVREAGGLLTEEDLASYSPKWSDPITGTFRGVKIFTHPPGSSGITLLQWLNILEGFEFDDPITSASTLHLFFESGKLALRDDDHYNSGKDYAKIPVDPLTSKDYAKSQREKVDRNKASFYDLITPARRFGESTTHFCVSDSKKNIVTLTQTQMYGFDRVGIYGDLGFNLNDGMCYFSLDPDSLERLEPRQRPRYVMSPTVAMGDDEVIALGAAGGWTIPQTIPEVLLKLIQYKMSPQIAVSSPRFVLRYRINSIPYAPGTVVDLEAGISVKTKKELTLLGHTIHEPTNIEKMRSPAGFGALHALVWKGTKVFAGTETRRRGSAVAL
jgi:gamma-glutamyltranspeptidase / glutathione hydrolase